MYDKSKFMARYAIPLCALLICSLHGIGCSRPSPAEKGTRMLADGDYENAAAVLSSATIDHPENAQIMCNLGLAFSGMGKHDRALATIRKALALSEKDQDIMEALALALQRTGKYEEAMTALNNSAAVELSPRILNSFASLEYQAGHAGKAAVYLEEALALDPLYPPALYNIALILRESSNTPPSQVIGYLRKFIMVGTDPNRLKRAREFLATVDENELGIAIILEARKLFKAGRPENALEILKQAAADYPGQAAILWELAVTHSHRLQNIEMSLPVYARFIELFPDDPKTPAARKYLEENAGMSRNSRPASPAKAASTDSGNTERAGPAE